jgi:hypothetical protein
VLYISWNDTFFSHTYCNSLNPLSSTPQQQSPKRRPNKARLAQNLDSLTSHGSSILSIGLPTRKINHVQANPYVLSNDTFEYRASKLNLNTPGKKKKDDSAAQVILHFIFRNHISLFFLLYYLIN